MDEPEEMGSDITFEHMLPTIESPSNVKNFFEGTHIFITGGTGFLGNLLIQKLMRSCPDLARIYILMRSKKGKSPETRLDDMFKDPVFERMIIEHENFYDKIQLVHGNCENPGLGLCEADRKVLIANVNVVFHLADTRFEEDIRKATDINVRATVDMITLAKEMQNLKAFVYVSSAYSHCPQSEIEEKFYYVPTTAEKLLSITNILDDLELKTLTLELLGIWPNTYTFTKAIAENFLMDNSKGLPVAIVRPSMVVSTRQDPLSGWTNNYYGPVGMVLAASLGLMRSFQAVPDYRVDMVPADYVVNSAIVSSWLIGKEFHNDTNTEFINKEDFHDIKAQNDIPIFNCVCSPENSITWREFMALIKINGFKFPALIVIWYCCFTLTPNLWLHKLYTIFFHYVPAFIIDTVLFFVGKKPMMIAAYRKLHYFQNYFSYFSMRQWVFRNNNTQALWKKLNSTDQRLFKFSMKDLFWNEYCFTFIRGSRVYLLKESMDTLPEAKKRYRKMKFAHYFLVTGLWFLTWMFIRNSFL